MGDFLCTPGLSFNDTSKIIHDISDESDTLLARKKLNDFLESFQKLSVSTENAISLYELCLEVFGSKMHVFEEQVLIF